MRERAKIDEQLQQEAKEICWRKQVDQNLKWLTSLLFGAELTSSGTTSQWLISSISEVDQAFIFAAKITTTRHSFALVSDRYRYSLPTLNYPNASDISNARNLPIMNTIAQLHDPPIGSLCSLC